MESSIQFTDRNISVAHSETISRPVASLSPKVQWGLYRCGLIISDISLSLLAFIFAGWIRFNVPLSFFNLDATPTIPSLPVIVFGFAPLWLIIYAGHGLYQQRTLLGGTHEYAGVFRATTIGMLAIVIFGFVQPILTPARGWALLSWALVTLFVVIGRFLLRRIVYMLRRRGYFITPALIIGDNPEAQSLAEQLLVWQTSGYALRGFVSANQPQKYETNKGDLPVLGTIDQIDELVHRHNIGELVLATSALTQDQILALFKRYGVSNSINLRLSTGLFEVVTTGLEVKEVASVPLVRVNQVRLTGVDFVLKNVLDISLGFLVLLASLPFLMIIAIAIKIDSPGKVFYRRRVMGINGSQFDAFKFRTMYTNGQEIMAAHPERQAELEELFKLKDDPRVTRVGRILRKYSLDELPQLTNVLLRQMSLVGPRMISPDELAKYEQWDLNLLTVPPGMTGLWQVSGRSNLSYSDRVQLDMRYIRNWSILLDLHILFRTISVVIKSDGAY